MKKVVLVAVVFALGAAAHAGIPQPDGVLYGLVSIDGIPVEATDDVSIIARVDGRPHPVGMYHMGDNSSAQDNYVLRIKVERATVDSPTCDDAAEIGDTARIFVKEGDDDEEFVREFVISGVGVIENLDLDTAVKPGNCAAENSNINLDDYAAFQGCVTGPVGDAAAGCDCADLDGDGDVDLLDWGRFQTLFTGP